MKNFSSLVTVGEKLYAKQIPIKKVTIDLGESIVINRYESLRLGIGAFTNRNVSEWFSVGFYTGYGIRDKQAKYNLYATLWPKNKWESQLTINHYKTVQEAASVRYPYHINQYSSEWIRSIGVSEMEVLQGFKLKFLTKPIKDTKFYADINAYYGKPSYYYEYKGVPVNSINYFEYKVGMNLSIGKRYFQLIDKQIPIKSPYPNFWIIYSSSIPGSLNDYDNQALDLRVDYTLKYLNLGVSKVRLTIGNRWGEIPLFKLYNHSGSDGFSGVTYNSFETMGYNEFLSSSYANIFLTHDFGRLFNVFSIRNFKPHAVLALNMGFGTLNEPSNYTGKEIKTLENGFYEIGALINNLYQINISALKTSLGLGFYYRVGPNRLDTFKANSALKVSFKFRL